MVPARRKVSCKFEMCNLRIFLIVSETFERNVRVRQREKEREKDLLIEPATTGTYLIREIRNGNEDPFRPPNHASNYSRAFYRTFYARRSARSVCAAPRYLLRHDWQLRPALLYYLVAGQRLAGYPGANVSRALARSRVRETSANHLTRVRLTGIATCCKFTDYSTARARARTINFAESRAIILTCPSSSRNCSLNLNYRCDLRTFD